MGESAALGPKVERVLVCGRTTPSRREPGNGILEARTRRSGLSRDRRPRRHRALRRRGAWRGPTSSRARSVRLGLQKGDSVAAVLPNGAHPFTVYLAALQTGLYYVPINYRLSAPEIAYILAGLRGEGVRQPRAVREARERGGRRGRHSRTRRASRHGDDSRVQLVRRARRRAVDGAAREPFQRRGDALHVGHDGQAQGREARRSSTSSPT